MYVMWRGAGIAAATALVLGGCGGETGSTAEATPEKVKVVVIGDSLINPDHGCPGCTGFVEQFTDHVASVLRAEADYETVPSSGVPDAVEVVSKLGPEADKIAAADVVVVQVGFNNALPDPETGIGCKTWLLDTEPECLAQGVKTYGGLYDQVFAGVKALRGTKPTVYLATTTIDGNIAPAEAFPDGLLAQDRSKEKELKLWAVDAYDRWNAMLTDRAAAAGFQVVDLYHALNGPDGTQTTYPTYTDDGAHPNQAGHDLIAAKLAEATLSAIDR
jgi:lysophospholipase L1-like esterase